MFVERLEAQLDGADDLPIRDRANEIYGKLVNAIFGSLTQMAKTDRGDGQAAEDKGQLNYHVIMIGGSLSSIEDRHGRDVDTVCQRTCGILSTTWPL